MAPTTTEQDAYDDWAPAARVFARPELCAINAGKSGFAGAWRLLGVSRAFREGASCWLRTLPGLIVCGGYKKYKYRYEVDVTDEVWRLDLAELRWERMPSLALPRYAHACCTVRGDIVVLGGWVKGRDGRIQKTASVEGLGHELQNPPLSCGTITCPATVAIQESESDQGELLMIGGCTWDGVSTAAVHKVDLATGACTAQPSLLVYPHEIPEASMASRLPDGRIVCAGSCSNPLYNTTVAQVLDPPQSEPGFPSDATWQWRHLPDTNVMHCGGRGCVLSDGRFAVFGGSADTHWGRAHTGCEVLTPDGDIERWDPLPPMHEARNLFACEAVGGCVIVAGGKSSSFESLMTLEVYEEALGRWRRLPCNLPDGDGVYFMGSALVERDAAM